MTGASNRLAAPAGSAWRSWPDAGSLTGTEAARKFTAASKAQPATSDIAADIIVRFVEQQRSAVARLQALNEQHAAGAIMTSPFIRIVTYSVLDGWRLVFAHNRRHVEQARSVSLAPGFPGS